VAKLQYRRRSALKCSTKSPANMERWLLTRNKHAKWGHQAVVTQLVELDDSLLRAWTPNGTFFPRGLNTLVRRAWAPI
jgi:hypothetical protein